jgi:hypothetical protein
VGVSEQVYHTLWVFQNKCITHCGCFRTSVSHTVGVSKQGTEEIFGPKTDKVTGVWRKLHIEGLYNLYSSPNIISDVMGETCSTDGEMRN